MTTTAIAIMQTGSVAEEETDQPITPEEIIAIYERYNHIFERFENSVADKSKPSIHILNDDCLRLIFLYTLAYRFYKFNEISLRNVMFVCKRWFVMCGEMIFCNKKTKLFQGFISWKRDNSSLERQYFHCPIIPDRIVLALYFSKGYIKELNITLGLDIGVVVIDNRNCIFGAVNNNDLSGILKATAESLERLQLVLYFKPSFSIPPNVRELVLEESYGVSIMDMELRPQGGVWGSKIMFSYF